MFGFVDVFVLVVLPFPLLFRIVDELLGPLVFFYPLPIGEQLAIPGQKMSKITIACFNDVHDFPAASLFRLQPVHPVSMVLSQRIEFLAHNLAHQVASRLILAGTLLRKACGTAEDNDRKQ
jgi:hypothetical protein